ncbi:MAG TPA: hypothetical protein VFU41_08285 [Gemmatimonadales bacterium]|nr:hypothetical protein [Gemmatimonadales bacterium]
MIRGALLVVIGLGTSAAAQSDTTRPSPELFAAAEPLALTLTTDLKTLLKDRDTVREYRGAVLSYVDPEGAPVSLDIRVRTRGHFRLKANTCQFPPIMLDLPRKAAARTVFGARDKLKLVTHCRNRDDFDQHVVQEYLVYRLYNRLTDRSFRVRLARMTYADSAGRDTPVTRYGFLLEDNGEMAARNQATVLEQKGLLQDDIDFHNMGLVAVFQYMVGNTDWSVWGLHNIELLRDSSGLTYAVPYDFDWSGVVDAPYAKPDMRLPIQSVRQRLFRGICRAPDQFAPLFAQFVTQKDTIYALYRNEPALSPKSREATLRYFDDFYKTIADSRAIKREFLQTCGNRS